MKSFVEAYSSLMGGGKSFSAIGRMMAQIKSGGIVFSNIELKLDPWFNTSYPMDEFLVPVCPLLSQVGFIPDCKKEVISGARSPVIVTDEKGRACHVFNSRGAVWYLRKFKLWNYQEGQYNYIPDDKVGPDLPQMLPTGEVDTPVLVILDEALDHFESSSENTNAEFRSFLRHCRKLGINLIFITQDFGSLEKKIRVLTHYVWIFRDLATFRVPIIGNLSSKGTLPPPWNKYIVQRQFHSKEFGIAKAEPINRVKFVPRDTFIFQCYQSVSLHNSNIRMDGKAKHYGSSGRIIRERKKMSKIERFLVYGLLVVALWFSFKKPPQTVVNQVSTAPTSAVAVVSNAVPVSDKFERNSVGEIVERLPLSWSYSGDSFRVWCDGVLLGIGVMTRRGVVESFSASSVKFRDVSGGVRWVYHVPSEPAPAKDKDKDKLAAM